MRVAAPARRPHHQRDHARLRVRQRRRRPVQRRARVGRAAARRRGPLGPAHPRRPPGPHGRRGRRDRRRHVRARRGGRASPTSPSAAPASPRVVDLRGTADALGRELQVTEVAVADELAAAAELVMGKATGVARRRRPRRRPGLAARGLGQRRRWSGRPPRTCSARAPRGTIERPTPSSQRRPRLPAQVDPGPAGVERASACTSPGRGGPNTGGWSTPAAAAIAS